MCDSNGLAPEIRELPIKGFIEASAIDYPLGQPGSVVFVAGCDRRCRYCQAAHLVEPADPVPLIRVEEVVAALEDLQGFVKGVTLTGGEVTIHRHLKKLLVLIKEMGFAIKVDTHGMNHGRLDDWLSAGLVDALAIDIKGPWRKYADVWQQAVDAPRIKEFALWLHNLITRNAVPSEFRTTVHRALHSPDDILETAQQIAGAMVYVIQPYKPVPGFDASLQTARDYDPSELREIAGLIREQEIVGHCYVRGYEDDDPV